MSGWIAPFVAVQVAKRMQEEALPILPEEIFQVQVIYRRIEFSPAHRRYLPLEECEVTYNGGCMTITPKFIEVPEKMYRHELMLEFDHISFAPRYVTREGMRLDAHRWRKAFINSEVKLCWPSFWEDIK